MQSAKCKVQPDLADDFTPEEQFLFAILIGAPLRDDSAAEMAAEIVPFPLLHRVHCYLILLENE